MSKLKSRKLAVILALAGTVTVPGLHKFYLGQPGWGLIYLLFFWTTIPQIASAIEGVWYLSQDRNEFDQNFNADLLPELSQANEVASARWGVIIQALRQYLLPKNGESQIEKADPARVGAIAQALRQLDSLRQEGLISEYEFEQQRRQLLE